MHKRWGGPLVAHLHGDPEQSCATAIGSLLEALHGRYEAGMGQEAPCRPHGSRAGLPAPRRRRRAPAKRHVSDHRVGRRLERPRLPPA
jgi:hypothetical protein